MPIHTTSQVRRHAVALVAIGLVATGCAVDDLDQVESSSATPLAGEPEVLVTGLLDFVNVATLEELDLDVGLNASAAAAIVAHRNGKTPSPNDDNPFDSYEELASVSYVSDVALNALVAYLFPDEVSNGAGVFEEVLFDSVQAAAAVDMANNMALQSLDCNAGLPVNAARGIVAARPIADMGALANVRYIGPAALESIRAYTVFWNSNMVVADTFDCVDFTAEQIEVAEEIINTAGWSQLRGVTPGPRNTILFEEDGRCREYFGSEPYTAPCRRTWTSLAELSDTYGIGPATMARLRELTDGWAPGQGRADTIRDFVDRAPACETMAIHVSNARVLEANGGCAWVTDWDETDTETYRVRVCTNPWDERYVRPEHVGYAWTFHANYTDPYFTQYGECVLVNW